mmetsp:Transcript_21625/g.31006  ORF Transcript_21625/g.31006 Transcript_21625/m.31006 type:complete len:124 (-) Transcript_21625:101-472(-)
MGRVVCVATGHIELYSNECLEAIEGKNIGIGQLFRYLGVLPSFSLLAVGRVAATESSEWEKLDMEFKSQSQDTTSAVTVENGQIRSSLWRQYELSCPQLRCRFTERFRPDFLELSNLLIENAN